MGSSRSVRSESPAAKDQERQQGLPDADTLVSAAPAPVPTRATTASQDDQDPRPRNGDEECLPHRQRGGRVPTPVSSNHSRGQEPGWQLLRGPFDGPDVHTARWVRGWSDEVTKHGTEAYCACGDAMAAATAASVGAMPISSLPNPFKKGRQAAPSSSIVEGICQSCGRPALLPPAPSALQLPETGRLKLSRWRAKLEEIKGRLGRRGAGNSSGNDHGGRHTDGEPGTSAGVKGQRGVASSGAAAGQGGQDQGRGQQGRGIVADRENRNAHREGIDSSGSEVDPLRLSNSSGGSPRPSARIARSQARLRRAQRLLERQTSAVSPPETRGNRLPGPWGPGTGPWEDDGSKSV